MQRAGIGFGIDRDGAHAEPLGGTRDTAGNFGAVGDEDGAQHLTASERVMGARSTHCAAGVWAALACGVGKDGGGGEGCDDGIDAVPGAHTGSTDGTKVAAEGAETGAGVLAALREDRCPDGTPRASAARFAGEVFGSGFIMLTAGIEAALGKSASRITFLCPAGGCPAASIPVEPGATSATGVSVGCPHSGK